MNLIFSEYQGAFETLLNSCDKLVMLFDINTKKIKYVNDAFCKAVNVVRDKTIGRSISKFLPSNNGRLEAIVEEIETNGKYVSNFYYSPMETNISLELKYLEYPGHKDIIAHFRPEKDETLKNKIKKLKDVIEKEYEMIDAFKKFISNKKLIIIVMGSLGSGSVNNKIKEFLENYKDETSEILFINRESINDFSLQYEGFISKKTIESLFSHVSEPYKELVDEFIDSSTLKDRLKDRDKINEEFISDIEGWCRIGFIVCERDENNNASKVLFTYRVINDAKNREISMQNAVKDALDSVKKANDIKTEFLSRMGHDIKTPLNSIIGMASIAKANSTNPEKVEQSLKKIMDASHQLTKLFSEVLDMSNIEAGNITFTKEEIEISDLFTNLINANKEGILSHHHKITIKNSGVKHEHILGDKTKLQQIFNNIFIRTFLVKKFVFWGRPQHS